MRFSLHRVLLAVSICCAVVFMAAPASGQKLSSFPEWEEGYLDIHFINTGCGNSSFLVFPDGSTMLVDAGDKDPDGLTKNAPWKVTAPYPDNSLSTGQWIMNYIRQVRPRNGGPGIDYAVVTHFHGDHYGVVSKHSKQSAHGYYLSGISEVGDGMPFGLLLDRGYPDYNFPVDLKTKNKEEGTSFLNYLAFIKYHQAHTHLKVEMLKPGTTNQVRLVHTPEKYPDFLVRGIKVNGECWTGEEAQVQTLFNADSVNQAKGSFTENALSLAMKLSYGKFDYFIGGDNTGLQGYGWPRWADTETPIAKVVGKVEALTLNHHGNRDGTNENFLRTLQPQVIVEQTWRSDHPGQEVLYRLIADNLYKGPKDIFATNIQEETKVVLGAPLINGYKSLFGHIMIRVLPGGNEFYVYVLENEGKAIKVSHQYGPYFSN
ncbi:ComEC/Rec2 family competence protein [Chitinophaga sp. 30R24]|uniref:ComEC/Rec2 family competence protein n=1 Tax=Chitinophaga sp. 30R24 TaxID=3248838 RepID=UPI003B8F52E2